MNSGIQEGEDKGKSALYFLAANPEGLQLLIDDANLLSKIMAHGLNRVVVEGEDEGKSALYFLARNPEGRQLLTLLRREITDQGLNSVIGEGEDEGKSALFEKLLVLKDDNY